MELFELEQIETQCSKLYFKTFLQREVGALKTYIDLEQLKSHPELTANNKKDT